ncbi:MAG: SPOR domain-containing protein [Candidatus Eisenbacteria bacterium]
MEALFRRARRDGAVFRKSSIYALQLGALSASADCARDEMECFARGLSVRLEEKGRARPTYVILLGRCGDLEEARRLADRLLHGIDFEVVTGQP